MKWFLLTIILCFCLKLTPSFCQTLVANIEEVQEQGIDIQKLDKKYSPAIQIKTGGGVLKDRKSTFMQEYQILLYKAVIYLNDHGIQWENNTMFVHRIYFSSNGTIDYFLFNTPNKNFNNEKIGKYLSEFSRDFQLSFSTTTPFRQCGTLPIQTSD